MVQKEEIQTWFRELQLDICSAIEKIDGKPFIEDAWERPGGGGGTARVLAGGNVIEKGGVNFSAVHGQIPEMMKSQLGISKGQFFATGVSIVMHPFSPKVPIAHMNVRYFETDQGLFWFGGGIDLTPIYVDESEAAKFHSDLKAVCDAHDHSYYKKFKNWADDYFYVKHRKETRGVGGIFFDHLNEGRSKDEIWSFVKAVGKSFAPIYGAILKNKKDESFTKEEKEWQLLRRGRYVEFNLVLDRGTKFGLETDGRTESILMSLPETAKWKYNHKVAQGSKEEKTLSFLKKGIQWV